jgi:hypothetical protein
MGTVEEAKKEYIGEASTCPRCGASPSDLAWFYFMSPIEQWENPLGRGGWITVCDPCHEQVDFFCEIIG